MTTPSFAGIDPTEVEISEPERSATGVQVDPGQTGTSDVDHVTS